MRVIVLIAMAVSGCGGSTGPTANCSPATYAACRPTGPRGCDLYSVGSVVVAAASCSGGDAVKGCQPTSTLECVTDCSAYSDCSAP